MSRKGIIQNAIVIVLGVAIICMSVGYAAFDSRLDIKGSATIQQANWDVHLENPIKTKNTTVSDDAIIIAPNVNASGTEVNFAVNLSPGQVYEFTVDVRNSGTFNAVLSNYTLVALENGVTASINDKSKSYEDSYLSYEIFGVSEGEALKKGSVSTKTIRIMAKQPTDGEVIEKQNFEFRFNMTYVQDKN